jgi:hypothetical protein
MAHCTPFRLTQHLRALRNQFLQHGSNTYAELLPDQRIRDALDHEGVTFRNDLYNPLVTLRRFLAQTLSPDPSCRAAVARFLAERATDGLPVPSADPGGYCKARARLPQAVLARLTRQTGQQLADDARAEWRWRGRRVLLVDGSTASMPDTADNRAAYPPPSGLRQKVAFPILRFVAVLCLATGALLDLALGPYRGKQTGENSLFRTLWDLLGAGDVVLGDRYFCSYFDVALLRQRAVDAVLRLHQRRPVDFRRGGRLGRDDRLVLWRRPARPGWMDEATYEGVPGYMDVRLCRVRVAQPGFRTRVLVVATTLWRGDAPSVAEIGDLYRARWNAELDLRSLKVTLGMDVLRAQSPEMVRKELWAHALGYNLMRSVMAQAASGGGLLPREISFKGAVQTVLAFAGALRQAEGEELARLCREVLRAIASHRVGDRPDRYEPRARKRRPKHYPHLNVPRDQAREAML